VWTFDARRSGFHRVRDSLKKARPWNSAQRRRSWIVWKHHASFAKALHQLCDQFSGPASAQQLECDGGKIRHECQPFGQNRTPRYLVAKLPRALRRAHVAPQKSRQVDFSGERKRTGIQIDRAQTTFTSTFSIIRPGDDLADIHDRAGVAGHFNRGDFRRNIPAEFRTGGAIHFAHRSSARKGMHVVRPSRDPTARTMSALTGVDTLAPVHGR
jgi:hypothetical protein